MIILLLTLLLSPENFAEAQQAKKNPHVGFLVSTSAAAQQARFEAFNNGLGDLGYVERKNILIDDRYAEGKVERLPDLASDLATRKVDVFVVGGTVAAIAAKKATTTTPIIVGGAGDLVGAGLVASLAKPGGNITGSTLIAPDLSGKRLELLREVIPKASRVAVLWDRTPGQSDEVRATEAAAHGLGVKVQPVELGHSSFQHAYAAITKKKPTPSSLFKVASAWLTGNNLQSLL
jgi:putative ABC transport system substrate-binding protein